jgi:hypothetical protein
MKQWCAIVLAVVMLFGAGVTWAHPGGEGPAGGGSSGPSGGGGGAAAAGGNGGDAAAAAGDASGGDPTDQGVGGLETGAGGWPLASPRTDQRYYGYDRRSPGVSGMYRERALCVGYYAPTGGLPCR